MICWIFITDNSTSLIIVDGNGNILSKVFYPYTTGTLTSATSTISYTYNSTWGDQLLTYNGSPTITYDQIGNPLTYGSYTFTWQKGRQLATANTGSATLQFTYNQDGNRTWKTKNNSSTQYTYASGLLVSQTDGTNTLNFTYDPDGIALGVNLDGTDYYYLYNAQGDVIALYDSTGTIVVEYVYDSWGKLLSTTGSGASTIGFLNPLRYRGYFYDTDLSLYLLETRYYDPETGRFINADGIVDNRGVQTTNLYAYCGNDPINNSDEDGHLWGSVIAGAVLGAGVGAVNAIIKHGTKNKKAIIKGAVIGGVTGAISGLCGVGIGRLASSAAKAAAQIARGGLIAYSNNSLNRIKVSKKSKKTKSIGNNKKNASAKAAKKKSTKTTVKQVKKTISVGNYSVDFGDVLLKKHIREDLQATGFGMAGGVYSASMYASMSNAVREMGKSALAEFNYEFAEGLYGAGNQMVLEQLSKQFPISLFPGE